MDLKIPRFYGESVCLAPIDPERDAEIESRWTHDAGYLRLLSLDPARPLSPAQVKKKYEALEKTLEEEKNQFYFAVRLSADDRLVGFARIYWIWWQHRSALVSLGIGDPGDRGRGYGTQALRLLLGGPSTGLATYTAQSDLPFALHAGHGTFPRLVVAPGEAEEAYAWSSAAMDTCLEVPAPGHHPC